MTFSIKIKEEISAITEEYNELRIILLTFLLLNAKIKKGIISFKIENNAVARKIYKCIKNTYGISPSITIRIQKRFRHKQIYILEIKEKTMQIISELKDIDYEFLCDSEVDKIAFLKGVFLACGSISDPKNSGYHLEFTSKLKKDTILIKKILSTFNINGKVIKRENNYMFYLKEAERISDVLKIIGAINNLFYFEDIRIYRDHKNMVNRLNNCDIANQEKTIKNGLKQVKDIFYIKENNIYDLFDDKSKDVINYRLKYPEVSYVELAEIISLETGYKITKSGINHHFIKIRKLIERHKKMIK